MNKFKGFVFGVFLATAAGVLAQQSSINPGAFLNSLTFGAAGVSVTQDGDGAITITGRGNGSDEDLTINLDDTADTVTISSSTGVARLDINGLALAATSFRIDFTNPCVKRLFTDYTADAYTDGALNLMYCFGTPFIFYTRIEGAQSGTPVVTGGVLDIDNDPIADEGIEMVLGDFDATQQGYFLVGSETSTKYFRARINIASVSGTDNFYFGWRQAETFVDNNVLATYNTYGAYHVNNNAGNIVIQTGDDTVDATDEEDQVANWADGEWHILDVRINNDGSFDFYIDGLQSTQTNAVGAGSAGERFIPFFGFLSDTDADAEITFDWMEFGTI